MCFEEIKYPPAFIAMLMGANAAVKGHLRPRLLSSNFCPSAFKQIIIIIMITIQEVYRFNEQLLCCVKLFWYFTLNPLPVNML